MTPYIIGSALTYGLLQYIQFASNKGLTFIGLGLLPFLQFFTRFRLNLDVTKTFHSFLCGLTVTGAQLIAGASGSMLDIFFVESALGRYQVIATKAATQCLGHSLKVVFYWQLVSFSGFFDAVPAWLLA